MKDYQKLFNGVKDDILSYSSQASVRVYLRVNTTNNDLKSLQELVDKATPMKMVESKDYKGFYDCKCHSAYKLNESNYCGYCGQALKWH